MSKLYNSEKEPKKNQKTPPPKKNPNTSETNEQQKPQQNKQTKNQPTKQLSSFEIFTFHLMNPCTRFMHVEPCLRILLFVCTDCEREKPSQVLYAASSESDISLFFLAIESNDHSMLKLFDKNWPFGNMM